MYMLKQVYKAMFNLHLKSQKTIKFNLVSVVLYSHIFVNYTSTYMYIHTLYTIAYRCLHPNITFFYCYNYFLFPCHVA